jgi:hypothetical protein
LSDIEETKELSLKEAKCPECGNLVADMGLDFATPRKDDIKSWKHLQQLYTVGITFHSCGCNGPGYIPKDEEEFIAYLQKSKDRYCKNLIEISPSKRGIKNDEEKQFWISAIKKVEEQLAQIK